MKAQNTLAYIVIFQIAIGFVIANKCPPTPPLTKIIDYDLVSIYFPHLNELYD